MKDSEIRQNIEDSVKIFREMLEKTFLDNHTPFYGIGYDSLTQSLTGNIQLSIKANGNFRIAGELPKIMLNKDCKGLPRGFQDWDIYPIVVRLFLKSDEEIDAKKK